MVSRTADYDKPRCVSPLFIMHLSLALVSRGSSPGTPSEPPGTRGEWYIFDNFLGARGGDIVWFWKRTIQTPGMHPRIWSSLISGTWFSKSRMNSLLPFVFHTSTTNPGRSVVTTLTTDTTATTLTTATTFTTATTLITLHYTYSCA